MESLYIFIQQLSNGLVIGMGYVLVAVGLTLIFGILHILNFAHGEFYMMGAIGTYVLITFLGINYLLAIVISPLVVFAIAMFLERVCLHHFVKSGERITTLLACFGLSIFIMNFVQYIWGPTPMPVPSPLETQVRIGPVFLTQQKIFVCLGGIIILAGIYIVIRWTTFGKVLRATGQDRKAAQIMGINVDSVYTITFGLGAGVAAISGALLSPIVYASPVMGEAALIKAFVVVILGGMGSITGSIVGGLILGFIDSIAGGYIPIVWLGVLDGGILIVMLLIKPSGLFGLREEM